MSPLYVLMAGAPSCLLKVDLDQPAQPAEPVLCSFMGLEWLERCRVLLTRHGFTDAEAPSLEQQVSLLDRLADLEAIVRPLADASAEFTAAHWGAIHDYFEKHEETTT